jgi:hypothetical protein
MTLRSIKETEYNLIADDPVRPHIPVAERFGNGRNVVVLEEEGKVIAVVCTALTTRVPTTEQEMKEFASTTGPTLVAYTVWSYSKGSGRKIINLLRDSAVDEHCDRLVTLSPLTEMAERFHLSNGATFLGKFETCQNFEYEL